MSKQSWQGCYRSKLYDWLWPNIFLQFSIIAYRQSGIVTWALGCMVADLQRMASSCDLLTSWWRPPATCCSCWRPGTSATWWSWSSPTWTPQPSPRPSRCRRSGRGSWPPAPRHTGPRSHRQHEQHMVYVSSNDSLQYQFQNWGNLRWPSPYLSSGGWCPGCWCRGGCGWSPPRRPPSSCRETAPAAGAGTRSCWPRSAGPDSRQLLPLFNLHFNVVIVIAISYLDICKEDDI